MNKNFKLRQELRYINKLALHILKYGNIFRKDVIEDYCRDGKISFENARKELNE